MTRIITLAEEDRAREERIRLLKIKLAAQKQVLHQREAAAARLVKKFVKFYYMNVAIYKTTFLLSASARRRGRCQDPSRGRYGQDQRWRVVYTRLYNVTALP